LCNSIPFLRAEIIASGGESFLSIMLRRLNLIKRNPHLLRGGVHERTHTELSFNNPMLFYSKSPCFLACNPH
jgi:hypothetical protein